VTQANDDAAAAGVPPTGGPPRAPVPPQAGGPPAYAQPHPYGPGPSYGPGPYGPPQQYGWRPPPMPLAPDGRPLADFGTRLLAHLIDGAILSAIALVVFLPVAFLVFRAFIPDFADPPAEDASGMGFLVPLLLLELGFILAVLAGYYIYFVEMMFRTGQTTGKKLMKIRVIPIEPGATLTRGMAAKRYLIEFPTAMVVPFFVYLDGLWQLWDKPYQQTLHDKVAKTVVIKVAP
jgi:uncharacterized RDD family membrane protein YckC